MKKLLFLLLLISCEKAIEVYPIDSGISRTTIEQTYFRTDYYLISNTECDVKVTFKFEIVGESKPFYIYDKRHIHIGTSAFVLKWGDAGKKIKSQDICSVDIL